MSCGQFDARVYVEAVFSCYSLPVFHAHRQAACSVLPVQTVVHFVVYGVVVLYTASSKDDVKVLSVFFLHGSVQCQTCQFFFPCSIGIGVFSCSVVQSRADCPVSFFLVVAYLGYVVGLFEAGVLFIQFVLPAQVSCPDAVFFFGQSYVSHSSLQVVVVSSPQKDGRGHGCFGAFHHLGFFASVDNGRLGIRIGVRIWVGIRIGVRIWIGIILCCRGIEVLALPIRIFVGDVFNPLAGRLGGQPFGDLHFPCQVLLAFCISFIVQLVRQFVQCSTHKVFIRCFCG